MRWEHKAGAMAIGACDSSDCVALELPLVRTVQFATQVQPIIDARCHRTGNARAGLFALHPDRSFQHLLEHVSEQVPELRFVTPLEPDSSYLLWKQENDPRIKRVGMSLYSTSLPEDEIRRIRAWILEGAHPN